jgi:YihY family inner membrane protein
VPDVQRYVRRIDAFQRRHRFLGFAYGVQKKFGDDSGGSISAVLTYYGFLSLFPLLLVLVTVLSFVLHDNPKLQSDILNSALADFPIIGDEIRKNVGRVHGTGIGLIIGILVTFYGGFGIANAAQDVMNRVWEVPQVVRPGFLPRLWRSAALIATLGVGILVTTGITTLGGAAHGLPMVVRVLTILAGFLLNIVLFSFAFRLLTAAALSWGEVFPGAAFAAFGFVLLQTLGGALVSHQLQNSSQTYGTFALVLGLLAWIYLQARIVVYGAELNVVRARHLWPRGLTDPLTEADHRVYEEYQRREVRHKDQASALRVTQSPDADEDRAHDDRSQRDDEATAR